MKKQILISIVFTGLATCSSFASETISSESNSQIASWAEKYPTCYNSLYLTADTALTVLAGYIYTKLFSSELLQKDWPDLSAFVFDMKQSYNGIHFLIANVIMLATHQAIHKTTYGNIFETTDEQSKYKAGLILLSSALAGYFLNHYINT